MNVADLAHLADVASCMRNNGIHRARFNEDGSVAECELDPKYTAPPPPQRPLTPEDQELAKRDAKRQAILDKEAYDALLFMASEGVRYPNDHMTNRAIGAAEELNS
jgi:hypothetical protein